MLGLGADSQSNYPRFIERVTKCRTVWGIFNQEGLIFSEATSEQYAGIPVIPFWSDAAYARRHLHEGEVLEKIDLEQFIFILRDMQKNGVLIGTNWDAHYIGREVEPTLVAQELLNEDESELYQLSQWETHFSFKSPEQEIERMVMNGIVWVIVNKEGVIISTEISNEYQGMHVISFASDEAYLRGHLGEDYALKKIDLKGFIFILQNMQKDGVVVGLTCDANFNAYEIEPIRVARELLGKSELEQLRQWETHQDFENAQQAQEAEADELNYTKWPDMQTVKGMNETFPIQLPKLKKPWKLFKVNKRDVAIDADYILLFGRKNEIRHFQEFVVYFHCQQMPTEEKSLQTFCIHDFSVEQPALDPAEITQRLEISNTITLGKQTFNTLAVMNDGCTPLFIFLIHPTLPLYLKIKSTITRYKGDLNNIKQLF